MRKITFLLLFTLSVNLVSAQTSDEIPDYCTSTETKKKCKESLGDYSYDASKATKITFKEKPQLKELEIPLYMGEKYRFIFSKEGLPQNVDIEVWDHKFESKKRELLFSSKDFPADQKEYIWEPEKSRKMYVNYKIPPTDDVEKKGCVVFVLGYFNKND